jgi:DNA-directed RNA polymerase subunit RPC12/RpoP
MTGNYICTNCSKAFKTNQHLTQHNNRKNKCKPCLSSTGLDLKFQNHENQNPSLLLNTLNTNINDYSVPNLIQLILTYKDALEKIKELEETVKDLEEDNEELERANERLVKKIKIADKFVKNFMNYCDDDNSENENESYVSKNSKSSKNSKKKEEKTLIIGKQALISDLTEDGDDYYDNLKPEEMDKWLKEVNEKYKNN